MRRPSEVGFQLVLCNLFRHPAITARSIATLDELSGGRPVLGLGSGWTETEFRMTGMPFPDPRLRMLDEALTCIRGVWTEAPFTFEPQCRLAVPGTQSRCNGVFASPGTRCRYRVLAGPSRSR